MTEQDPSTSTGPADEACPGCGATTDVLPINRHRTDDPEHVRLR